MTTETFSRSCPVCGKLIYYINPIGFKMASKRKSKCPTCYNTRRSTTEKFLRRARQIWGDLYDYSKAVYNGSTNVTIICPTHGEFSKSPANHVNGKQGCPQCSGHRKQPLSNPHSINQNVSYRPPEAFIGAFKQRVSEDIFNRSQIFWFKGESAGIVCINVRKNNSECWNLMFIASEFYDAIEFINNGKLNNDVWTSTNCTLHNHWSKKAFELLLQYSRTLPDFREE